MSASSIRSAFAWMTSKRNGAWARLPSFAHGRHSRRADEPHAEDDRRADASVFEHRAARQEIERIAAVLPDRLIEQIERRIGLPGVLRQHAHHIERIRLAGIERQRAPIAGFRFEQAPGTVIFQADLQLLADGARVRSGVARA